MSHFYVIYVNVTNVTIAYQLLFVSDYVKVSYRTDQIRVDLEIRQRGWQGHTLCKSCGDNSTNGIALDPR